MRKKWRVLVLMHESLVPPDELDGYTEQQIDAFRTEDDVMAFLENAGHEVRDAHARVDEEKTAYAADLHRADVLDLLAAVDVMALSSHYEGTAGIALEAMAMGTPIVSTRLDGMEGILEHEVNALVVDIGDVAAMAAAISRMPAAVSNLPLARLTVHRPLSDCQAR